MTAVEVLAGPIDDAQRGERLYRGDILVFKNVPALGSFCALSDRLIRAAFGGLDPTRAQFGMDRDTFSAAVGSLQTRYREHADVGRLFCDALREVGADLGRTCWDRLYLRVLPHGDDHPGRRTQGLGFHRDTWSSNVYPQANWWTPIYPLTAERTIAFYPAYWSRPLANTSGAWDLEAIRARRTGAAGPALPIVPEPNEPVDTSSELRMVVEPGDLLCFSGAHLHASVPNLSGLTRFSVEVRTADVEDIALGRGAPNLDGAAPRVPLDWFHRITDGVPLPALLRTAARP